MRQSERMQSWCEVVLRNTSDGGNRGQTAGQIDDKRCEKCEDGDSGLVVDCPWNNCEEVLGGNEVNSKSGGDSGLGIDIECRLSKLSCGSVDERKLTDVLRNVQNTSKQCRRIISQISPELRLGLLEQAFAPNQDGDTLLHLSTIHKRLDVIFTLVYLVSHPSYLDVSNNLSQTAMHLAVLTGQAKVVRRLLLAGASPTLRDQGGNTPLHLACQHGQLECVKELTRPINCLEMHYLQLMNSVDHHDSLPHICIPPNLELRNYEGRTCVHIATLNQHTDILLCLKHFGANINAQESKGGRTPLTYAVEARNCNLVGFLVEECEADVDIKNYAGLSPFQIAHRMDDKIANLLMSLGACPLLLNESDSDFDMS